MSSKEKQVEQLTTYMANFVSHIGKVLPDDIIAKLDELAEKEDSPLSKVIYETMKKNQVLAKTLNRPSCQDTGVLQFWVKCGTNFPLIGELEALLKEAVVKATFEAPLRHNFRRDRSSAFQESSDASAGKPQRERARSFHGETSGRRHQRDWPWTAGYGRKVLRYGRTYREHRKTSFHHRRSRKRRMLVSSPRPHYF